MAFTDAGLAGPLRVPLDSFLLTVLKSVSTLPMHVPYTEDACA